LNHADLPRSDDLPRLPYRLADTLRRPARLYFRQRYDVTVHDEHLVPRTGPVLFAANHLGVFDGPFLVAFAPRMVHALVKREMFVGNVARGLHAVGQIPVERNTTDPLAVRTALRVLRDGDVLAVYPEGTRGTGDFTVFKTGVAYLALATGAPVVPVVCLGTRTRGMSIDELPPRGTRIDLVYGAPIQVEQAPFPRRQAAVRELAADLHETLRSHVQKAVVATGNPLPGAPITDEELT
jgi:1-acyl-sn-glycerol-3-phosphate acyltransferase